MPSTPSWFRSDCRTLGTHSESHFFLKAITVWCTGQKKPPHTPPHPAACPCPALTCRPHYTLACSPRLQGQTISLKDPEPSSHPNGPKAHQATGSPWIWPPILLPVRAPQSRPLHASLQGPGSVCFSPEHSRGSLPCLLVSMATDQCGLPLVVPAYP